MSTKMKVFALIVLILASLITGNCSSSRSFDGQLKSIVKPHLFSIAGWESRAIPREISQWIFGRQEKTADEIETVTEYFSATERITTLKAEIAAANAGNIKRDPDSLETELNKLAAQKLALKGDVERIIEKQIRDILTQQGIFNPVAALKVSFPPLRFRLEKPPHLLVISPRDRIESIREITLKPSLDLDIVEDVEARADELGVSSLVVGLGGLGATYPTFVTNEASLQFTIDTIAEEWLHQYLVFKPLGFLYLLDLTGLSRNYDIATMNETLAGMVSKEIGSRVYEKYYSEHENSVKKDQPPESESDFNREMREIRRTVDVHLANGEIKQAEEFMEEKRLYLASRGYYIRKLNQAYFAYHGTYADRPTSVSPIGFEMKTLRDKSASLKNFLDTVAAMTNRQSLIESIK